MHKYAGVLAGLEKRLSRLEGKREAARESVLLSRRAVKELKAKQDLYMQAREVVQKVAKLTQEELSYRLSDLATIAMGVVFDDPYEIVVEFVERRGRTECDIKFMKGEEKETAVGRTGGGAKDIAAFALRIAVWGLYRGKKRPVFIMDEPFRNVSRDLQEQTSEMVKYVSDMLGLQFIIVSHDPNLIEHADRIFEVTQADGVSLVTAVRDNP